MLTNGELQIGHNVTINGPGAASLAVNGNAQSRVFHNFPGVTASISGLTVTNGFTSGNYPANEGAGIFNDQAALTLSNCLVTGNSAPGNVGTGGGISNDASGSSATLQIDNCTVSNNSVSYEGGGIGNPNGAVTVTNSTISDNSAGYAGGGISNPSHGGTLTLMNTTISRNSAGAYGGVVQNDGTLTVNNSTMSDNSAGTSGGGIYNEYISGGTVIVNYSTISGNTATTSGGGIANLATNGGHVFCERFSAEILWRNLPRSSRRPFT